MSRFLAVLFVVMLVSLLPGVSGQTPGEIQFLWRTSADEGPVVPGEPTERIAVLEIRCAPGTAPPMEPLSFALKLEFLDDAPHAAVYEETILVDVPAGACAAGQVVEHPVPFNLTLSIEAPALEPIQMNITALEAGGRYVTHVWEVLPALVAGLEASTEHPFMKTGPNTVLAVPLRFHNTGNAPLSVRLQLAKAGAGSLSVALPAAFVIERGDRMEMPVELKTPFENGFNERTDEMVVYAVWNVVDDPETNGTTPEMTVSVETVGMYAPGPAGVWTALLIVGMVGLGRRRGKS